MSRKNIPPLHFIVLVILALSGCHAPVNAQSVSVEQTRNQEGSSGDDDVAGIVGDSETNDNAQQVDKEKEPEFKVGRIIFPSYDFELGKKKLSYGLYLPKSFEESKIYSLVVVLHGLNSNPGQILAYPSSQSMRMITTIFWSPQWGTTRGVGTVAAARAADGGPIQKIWANSASRM